MYLVISPAGLDLEGPLYQHATLIIKTIVTDAPPLDESGRRRHIAFAGGLDITDGRYDTPEFPLFSTLNTLHAGDFYQNCTPGSSRTTGPKQPWNDIHARVKGPAAKYICQNFMNRWVIQSKSQTNCLIPWMTLIWKLLVHMKKEMVVHGFCKCSARLHLTPLTSTSQEKFIYTKNTAAWLTTT